MVRITTCTNKNCKMEIRFELNLDATNKIECPACGEMTLVIPPYSSRTNAKMMAMSPKQRAARHQELKPRFGPQSPESAAQNPEDIDDVEEWLWLKENPVE
jgi:hypothetical protein